MNMSGWQVLSVLAEAEKLMKEENYASAYEKLSDLREKAADIDPKGSLAQLDEQIEICRQKMNASAE